jgi:hypothetical protein
MKKIILGLCVIISSCAYRPKVDVKPISIIESYKLDTTKIRFNGYYNVLDVSVIKIPNCDINETKVKSNFTSNGNVDKKRDSIIFAVKSKNCENNGKRNSDVYKSIDLMVFGKTNFFYFEYEKIIDNSAQKCFFYEEIYKRHKLYNFRYERFSIKNDSIYGYVSPLITVGAGQRVPVYCNYRGYVKNRDTITDWKVIPPYPKDFTKFVIEKNKDLFQPKTLYFVKTDAVKCLKMDEFK